MPVAKVRSVLALLVVGVFMTITAVMALYPILSPTQVALNDYADFFAKTASVYNGIVGVIIGYYFGRAVDNKVAQPGAQSATASTDLRGA